MTLGGKWEGSPHGLHYGSCEQDRITASLVETTGMVQSTIGILPRAVQGTWDICVQTEAARRGRVGYALVFNA